MRAIVSLIFLTVMVWGGDATIEVRKKVDALPSIAVEDASVNFQDTTAKRFYRALVGDLNVLSIFNVDRHYSETHYNNEDVVFENKDFDYVVRFRLRQDDNGAFNVDVKLIQDKSAVLEKTYRINNENLYMFISHTIAYDINNYMGQAPVEWMKRKVIISRLTGSRESEILVTDYTLTYQHVMVKGGLNVFPKWANNNQDSFYYTALDGAKPTLYRMDMRLGKNQKLLSSDGMLVVSDVSDDGQRLLLTMAPNGQPDIYLYEVPTGKYTRQTKFGGIDVNGQFMDNNQIAFVSDRLGYPNVFSKRINSSSVEQLVYYGKSNSACSAHNEYIAYSARESSDAFSKNTFNLHLISTKTDFIRRLTATGINEFPRFSHDGDAVLFIKNYKNQSSIGIIRLEQNKNYLFPLNMGKIQSMDW